MPNRLPAARSHVVAFLALGLPVPSLRDRLPDGPVGHLVRGGIARGGTDDGGPVGRALAGRALVGRSPAGTSPAGTSPAGTSPVGARAVGCAPQAVAAGPAIARHPEQVEEQGPVGEQRPPPAF